MCSERELEDNKEGMSEDKNKMGEMKSIWCERGVNEKKKEEQRKRLWGQERRRGGECT